MDRIILSLLLLAGCLGPVPTPRPIQPNVVLILVDDLGSEALGCYGGSSYRTPRLDALAAGGLRFTHAYSQTLCTPSRVKLMTGKSNLRNYVHFSILDPEEPTIGDVAKEAGYATAVVGKWQLLGAKHYGDWAGKGKHPRDAGFDHWCLWQVAELGSRYQDPTIEVDGALRNEIEGEFGPDLFCDYLLQFAALPRQGPFFVYYPMVLTHEPFVKTPDSAEGKLSKQERFADMVEYMDTIVGRIDDGLKELGLRENTLLLYVTDNGSPRPVRSLVGAREVKGAKGLSTDTGIRVPLIASWPGTIAPGGVCDDLVDLSDFLPTLAKVFRFELGLKWPIDGRSFLPQLLGERGDPREVLALYSNPRPGEGRNPRVFFARDHRYKLYDDGGFFDTQADRDEEEPLEAESLTPELETIRKRLQQALDEMPPEPAHLRAVEEG